MLKAMNAASKSSNRWLGPLVGLVWGAVWGLFVPLTPLVSLDLQSRDLLSRLAPRGAVPAEVVLVGIDARTGYVLPITYASLLDRLFKEAGAKVVVLSLPTNFSKPAGSDYYEPLREVVARYSARLVLESVPANGKVDVYSNLLPFDNSRLTYSVEPDQVVGVRQFLTDSDDIVRHTRTEQNLRRQDSGTFETFFSTDFLAARKFLGRSPRSVGLHERIHMFGPDRTFTEFALEQICPPQLALDDACAPVATPGLLDRLRGKIVLVGNVDDHQDATTLDTPFGTMDALDLHGHLVANLLTGRTERQLAPVLDILLTIGFGILSGWVLTVPRARVASLGLLALYALLTIGLALANPALLLPVVPPLAAFVFAGNTLFYLRRVQATQDRLATQEEELNRLRRAEREAVLNQAKKLLFRVATDIHDRPLQELKLVMDNLEALLIELPSQSSIAETVDRSLADLQNVGRSIRLELNDLRSVAEKLEITPALKNGLHAGLHAELDRLIDSGELRLTVERAIFPLVEPTADSRWLDQREDLYRFFKEAIANAMRHGQTGGATWLGVHLHQQDDGAELRIENDGPPLGIANHSGGYGTKIMNTIAGELMSGRWERVNRSDGGVRVRLFWQMPTARTATE